MSAANAPFEIMPTEDDPNDLKKDQYVSFDIPLDPKKPEGLKASTKFKILNSSNIEDILYFLSRLDDLIIALSIPEGVSRFTLVPVLLGHDHKKTWNEITTRIAPKEKDRDQENFEKCVETFLLTKMDSDISLDIKEWLRAVKKPRSMSVADFVERLRHINNLIEYCPVPDPSQPSQQTRIFSDPELTVILKNACPRSWSVKQVEANLKIMSLQQQEAYFTGLRKVEQKNTSNDSGPANKKNRRRTDDDNNHSDKVNDANSRNTNNDSGKKNCLIHGWCTHSTKECNVVKEQRTQYNSRNRVSSNSPNSKHNNDHINVIEDDIENKSRNSSQQGTEHDNTDYDEDYWFDNGSD